jgi:rod shape-determining protein MreC
MQKKTFHIILAVIILLLFFETHINKYVSFVYMSITKYFYQYTKLIQNKKKFYKIIAEINKIKRMNYENHFLKQEIDLYRYFINNGKVFNKNLLLTEVLGYVNTKKEKFIIINKGSEDFISEDMVVITTDNVILGRITVVYDYFSIVKLLDNDDQYIAGIIDKKIEFMIKGQRSQQEYTMNVINVVNKYNLPIENNMLVYTSGKGLVYPAGYCIGVVNCIDSKGAIPHIIIKNMYEIDALDYCYIIVPPNHKKNIEFMMQYKDTIKHSLVKK